MTEIPSPEDAGRQALQILDAVLQKKPEKDDHALTDATQKLCLLRDELIERARGGDAVGRERLANLNAVLSIVAAVHFPLGSVPWDDLKMGRDALARLVDGIAPVT